MQRVRGAASLALLTCAQAFAPTMQAFAPTMLAVRRPVRQASADYPSMLEVPHRWQSVHECERPAKWRESMSHEDCEVYELELAAGRTESAGRDIVLERRRRFRALGRPGWRRKYSQVVPQLSTMDEFLAANRRAAARDRLLVIVAYSHRCKACKRIASKFRRSSASSQGLGLGFVERAYIYIYVCEHTRLEQGLCVAQYPRMCASAHTRARVCVGGACVGCSLQQRAPGKDRAVFPGFTSPPCGFHAVFPGPWSVAEEGEACLADKLGLG